MMILAVFIYPVFRKSINDKIILPNDEKGNFLRLLGSIYDLLIIISIIFVQLWTTWDVETFMMRYGDKYIGDIIVGSILIFLVLDGTRRAVGWAMVFVAGFFMLHALYAHKFFGFFYGPPTRLAKYIDTLRKSKTNFKKIYKLSKLRTICSTGSPLSEDSFEYVYKNIKKDVHLASISGGTDIVSCFVLGNLYQPVYSGEIQNKGLGMDVRVFSEKGKSILNKKGELVCINPFPSMPLKFWNDPKDFKFNKAYFKKYKNIWHHGDYAKITKNNGFVIFGRSDTTLNPGGVRLGTAEIYSEIERFKEIKESLVVGQSWDNDVRIILFVILNPKYKLNENLLKKLKLQIRKNASPRHVPRKVIQIKDIPRTKSGKIVELAVKDIIDGNEIKNKEALANPESLKQFKNIEELKIN